jgi:hypothetical protein
MTTTTQILSEIAQLQQPPPFIISNPRQEAFFFTFPQLSYKFTKMFASYSKTIILKLKVTYDHDVSWSFHYVTQQEKYPSRQFLFSAVNY